MATLGKSQFTLRTSQESPGVILCSFNCVR